MCTKTQWHSAYPVIEMFIQGQAPLRISFLFDIETTTRPATYDEWCENLSHVVLASYQYLYQHKKPQLALAFLSAVNSFSFRYVSFLFGSSCLKKD